MGYREVTMIEVKEVLRLWRESTPKKRIAAMLGLDPKTVRHYVKVAADVGLGASSGPLTEAELTTVLLALHPSRERPHGESWAACEAAREDMRKWLKAGLRLTKIRKLLGRTTAGRNGVDIPYPTLHRFAVAELGFGRTAPTIAVADCGPGEEVQLDTGWVGWLVRPDGRRRFRAWIFTAVLSRYRFVYPCFQETTATAIEACEAAWAFYGGVFKVVIPDNTKAIVKQADPLAAQIVEAFLEYAQDRGFHIDPTRVRHPRDKARVERSVPVTRDDCFAGEVLDDLDAARARAHVWCREEYGQRRHTRTQRRPREYFEAEERAVLLPAPVTPYDLPLWSSPKVGRDQYAAVAKALYSLPTKWRRVTLRARADRQTVRFYHAGTLIKTHVRQPPGGRATDKSDFPVERSMYALRDVTALIHRAEELGPAVGHYAQALLDVPLPWTRMRRVYALLGLGRRYGATRLNDTCRLALSAEMLDVTRLARMLAIAAMPPSPPSAVPVPAPARFLRPSTQYRLPLRLVERAGTGEDQ
jgi:hypothetical protein